MIQYYYPRLPCETKCWNTWTLIIYKGQSSTSSFATTNFLTDMVSCRLGEIGRCSRHVHLHNLILDGHRCIN